MEKREKNTTETRKHGGSTESSPCPSPCSRCFRGKSPSVHASGKTIRRWKNERRTPRRHGSTEEARSHLRVRLRALGASVVNHRPFTHQGKQSVDGKTREEHHGDTEARRKHGVISVSVSVLSVLPW